MRSCGHTTSLSRSKLRVPEKPEFIGLKGFLSATASNAGLKNVGARQNIMASVSVNYEAPALPLGFLRGADGAR